MSGSSSGGSSAAAHASGVKAATSAILIPGGQPGSLIHSGNGFGSSSLIPGVTGPLPLGLVAAAQGTPGGGPPLAVVVALAVLLVGLFAGARAWRSGRHESAVEFHQPRLFD